MNKQIESIKDMREQKTHKVLWSALVVVFSLVIWCPHSFAQDVGVWNPGSGLDFIFTHPFATVQHWFHDGLPKATAPDSNFCMEVGICCAGVAGVPWPANAPNTTQDASLGLINDMAEMAVIIDGNDNEIHVWHRTDGIVGAAVVGGATVQGFLFVEICDLDGDANTDIFTLENGGAQPGWYEFDGTNFERVSLFNGAGYKSGTVGYVPDDLGANNTCIITFDAGGGNIGAQKFGVSGGQLEHLGSYGILSGIDDGGGTGAWAAISLGNIDYDENPDLCVVGENDGIIRWLEWNGSDFAEVNTFSNPDGIPYVDLEISSDIQADGIGDLFAVEDRSPGPGRVNWMCWDGGVGLQRQERICGSDYVRITAERDDSLVPIGGLPPTPLPPTPTVTPVLSRLESELWRLFR